MKTKDWLKIFGISLLSYLQLKAQTSLEFIVNDTLSNPLNQSTLVMQGISNTDYLETKNTGDNNTVDFNVPQDEFFSYFAYKSGYEIKNGTVFSNEDKEIIVNLNQVPEGKWFSYYLNDGNLEGSFISFDEDVYYEGGDPFNYEIEITNVSDDIITITNYDLLTYVSDSLGNFVPCPTCVDSLGNPIEPFFDDAGNLRGAWKKQPPDFRLSYELNFKPRKGWLRVSTHGNDIEYSTGEASGYLNEQHFDITGDGEFVSTTNTTRNLTPSFINGTFYFNASLDYLINGNKNNISIISQPFYVSNPIDTTETDTTITDTTITDTSTVSIKDKTPLNYKILRNYPNPFNEGTTIQYILDKRSEVSLEIYDILGKRLETLVNGTQNMGDYNVEYNPVSSGIYFYKLEADDKVIIRKMVKLK